MYRFIQFMRDKKRLCFLGIKRNKPSFCRVIVFSRSRLISAIEVSGFSRIINKQVSSAKRQILDPISITMSLIKCMKRRGPRIEP